MKVVRIISEIEKYNEDFLNEIGHKIGFLNDDYIKFKIMKTYANRFSGSYFSLEYRSKIGNFAFYNSLPFLFNINKDILNKKLDLNDLLNLFNNNDLTSEFINLLNKYLLKEKLQILLENSEKIKNKRNKI